MYVCAGWVCGGNYVFEDGHRGHVYKIFPRPSEFKHCCNDWKMWGLRTGAVLLAVPAGAVVIGVGAVVLPVFVASILLSFSAHPHIRIGLVLGIKALAKRTSALIHRMRTPPAPAAPAYQSRQCQRYYDAYDPERLCLSCTGHSGCNSQTHVFALDKPNICQNCGHFQLKNANHFLLQQQAHDEQQALDMSEKGAQLELLNRQALMFRDDNAPIYMK